MTSLSPARAAKAGAVRLSGKDGPDCLAQLGVEKEQRSELQPQPPGRRGMRSGRRQQGGVLVRVRFLAPRPHDLLPPGSSGPEPVGVAALQARRWPAPVPGVRDRAPPARAPFHAQSGTRRRHRTARWCRSASPRPGRATTALRRPVARFGRRDRASKWLSGGSARNIDTLERSPAASLHQIMRVDEDHALPRQGQQRSAQSAERRAQPDKVIGQICADGRIDRVDAESGPDRMNP